MTERTRTRRSLADDLKVAAPGDMAAARAAVEAVALINSAMRVNEVRQIDLARRIGVTEGRVSQVVNGDGNVRVSTLARFLRAAGYRLRLSVTPVNRNVPPISRRPRDPSRREIYISSKSVVCHTDDGVRTEKVLEISKSHPRTFAAETREWTKNVSTGEVEMTPRGGEDAAARARDAVVPSVKDSVTNAG